MDNIDLNTIPSSNAPLLRTLRRSPAVRFAQLLASFCWFGTSMRPQMLFATERASYSVYQALVSAQSSVPPHTASVDYYAANLRSLETQYANGNIDEATYQASLPQANLDYASAAAGLKSAQDAVASAESNIVIWEAADDDLDTVTNGDELNSGTDPDLADTDGDGYSDGEAARGVAGPDGDIDGDGISNAREIELGTNLRLRDTDHDGLNDGFEVDWNPTAFGLSTADLVRCPSLDPLKADTDADSFGDASEVRAFVQWWVTHAGSPHPAADALPPPPVDSDSDNLSDAEEQRLGTNPFAIDTDHDGLTDFEEVAVTHTPPLTADADGNGFNDREDFFQLTGPKADIDGDGLTNAEEEALGTDKRKADTDGDGLSDGFEVNRIPSQHLTTIGSTAITLADIPSFNPLLAKTVAADSRTDSVRYNDFMLHLDDLHAAVELA